MKLRYLRLQRIRPPLRDLALTFPQDPLLSAQPLSLRFIVGLNGSGKSTLLQTLAEIFVALDRDGQPPAFPLWLAYDLEVENQLRTVYLCAPRQQQPALIVFEKPLPEDTDWDAFTNLDLHTNNWPPGCKEYRKFVDALPGGGEFNIFLPSAVLAYTSGITRDWETIFAPIELVLAESSWALITPEDERPTGWDVNRENEQRQRLGDNPQLLKTATLNTLSAQFIGPANSFLIDTPQLGLASTIIMLKHLADEGQNESLQKIFDELRLRWEAPLALSLWVNLDSAALDANHAAVIADLMKLAAAITPAPEPSQWRQLTFNLLARVPTRDYNANPSPEETDNGKIYPGPQRLVFGDLIVKALLELLGGVGGKTYDVFRNLSDWQQNNLVRDVRLVMRKNDIEDVLLLDWLSDGERMLLGRIALFYLLRDKRDALLILDEPETHFNDAWKRRLVDMLDDALRESAHQVVISTHSSILLSDVFNTEITVLQQDGIIYEPSAGTFGTLPSEIMRNLFGAENPIGDRAKEFLDAVLTLVEFPDIANDLWRELDQTPNATAGLWIGEQHPFGRIIQIFTQREKENKLPRRTPDQWLRLFQGLHRRTRVKGTVTLAAVFEMLFDYVGAGYYQFELRRQHRRLTQAGENAPPS